MRRPIKTIIKENQDFYNGVGTGIILGVVATLVLSRGQSIVLVRPDELLVR